jgi:hypothetical protein
MEQCRFPFFTLPPLTSSEHPLSKPKTYPTNDAIGSKTGILYSDGNVAFGLPPDPVGTLNRQDPQYIKSKNNHELHCSRLSLEQLVNEEEKYMKEMNYSRSAAYKIRLVQSKSSALDTNSSILSRDALLPEHRDFYMHPKKTSIVASCIMFLLTTGADSESLADV